MTGVGGVGRGGGGTVRQDRGGTRPASGFRMSDVPVPGPLAAGVIVAPTLLAMAAAAEPGVRDREARRHSGALLAGLAALQRALLGGTESGTLERLSALLKDVPVPDDPRLAELQRALLVRTAVELARHQVAASV